MSDRVPRMDDLESRAWRGLMTLVELLPESLDQQLQRDAGLTHFEFVVLSQLRFARESTMQSKELAARTNATLPRLSHVVTRLAARGLVERMPCPTDKRATNVRLLGAGRSAVVRATAGHIAHARGTVIDRLDRAQLASLAEITEVLDATIDPQRRVRMTD